MNKRFSKFYVAILDNRVVVFNTNLANFIVELRGIEPGINSLSYYDKRFRKEEIMYYTSRLGKTYTIQKLINPYLYQ
tara:strand:- start:910 stop:1140 length:231 start_codon:yes stop_codon:yes gene_type:complete